MIIVDAAGSAGFPAGDAPRTWHAQPADLATQSQLTAAVGSSVSSTVSPATGQVRASTPMRQAGQPLSTARVQAPEEPVPGTRRLSGLSWLRSLVAMHDREPAVKAGDTRDRKSTRLNSSH